MTNRIVDAHNHPNWHGMDVDRHVANMDTHGIARTWLLSWEIPAGELEVVPHYQAVLDPRQRGLTLSMIIDALKQYPGRFIGGWAPDPRERSARDKLTAAVAIHGIQVYGELKCRMHYDNPDAIAMFHHCAALRLPVVFHLEAPECRLRQQCRGPREWPEWYGGDITVVDRMCRLCPQTTFIGHGPGFWREISGGAARNSQVYPDGPVRPGSRLIKLLRKHANLYCDLSAGSGCNALTRDAEHAGNFIRTFQDRILFGRDAFDDRLHKTLQALRLDKPITEKILFRNAEKLLNTAPERLK
jgi:predicted TIM-barrel fold metal-dependent hydrolase